MNFKKIAALVLAVAIGLTPVVFTSCDGDSGKKRGDASEITDLPPSFGDELKDFDGMRFNVLTKLDRSKTQAFNIIDLVGGETNLGDEAVVKAVETRNQNLYDVFGFEIVRTPKDGELSVARTAIMQRDKSYKAFMLGVNSGIELACDGNLVDMKYSSYVDFERDYWDDAVINNLLLDGGAYIALGDINTVDEDCTMCVLFNKKLWRDEAKTDPKDLYDIVKAGNWTLETMKNYSIAYHTEPTSGDSTQRWDPNYTGEGTYGSMVEDGDTIILLQASGNTVSRQDENSAYGFVNNMSGNEEFYSAVRTIYDFFGGEDKTGWQLSFERDVGQSTSEDRWDTVMRRAMKDDKVLFFMCHVGTIGLLRDMESDFGVLPIPKLTAEQEVYGNTIQYPNATCYTIPEFTEKENEEVEYILEAICYYSSSSYYEAIGSDTDRSLRYAYRETVLKRKATRDDDSMEMLDLVFNNRIFDVAIALKLNGIDTKITEVCRQIGTPETLVSSMPNFNDLIKQKLDKLLSK